MLVLFAGLAGCGPNGFGRIDSGVRVLEEGLSLGPDTLVTVPSPRRAALFEAARSRSLSEADAQLLDAPAVFAVERQGRLAAAELPPAKALLEGPKDEVDLDCSADPWRPDPDEALAGASERELAGRVASSLAARAGLAGRPCVERDLEAPYAAVIVQGQVRLNPALVFLAAGVANAPAVESLFPALALAAIACVARRRKRA